MATRIGLVLYTDPLPVRRVLDLMDLTDRARVRVGALSGGQRRRVDVGLGFIGRPDVLFLDEPTTGLDREMPGHSWNALGELAQASATTIVLTTHYLEEAAELADRVVVLMNGRKISDATPTELRAGYRPSIIRYPVPPGAPVIDLAAELNGCVDGEGRTVVVRTTDVAATLERLIGWAARGAA